MATKAAAPPPDEAAILAAKALDHQYDGAYKIIRGTDIVDLMLAVNASMEQGWMPIGGVAIEPLSMAEMMNPQSVPHPFYQALVFQPTQWT